jgi:hypothetical protein
LFVPAVWWTIAMCTLSAIFGPFFRFRRIASLAPHCDRVMIVGAFAATGFTCCGVPRSNGVRTKKARSRVTLLPTRY